MRTVVIIEPHPLFRLGLRQLLTDALPRLAIHGHDYSSLDESPGSSNETCELLLLSLTAARCGEKLAKAAVERFSPMRILLLAEADNLPSTNEDLPECVAGYLPREAPPEILQASVSLVLAGGTCFPARWSSSATSSAQSISAPASAAAVNPARYQPARWEPRPPHASSALPAVPAIGSACPTDAIDIEFSAPIKPGSAAHKESQLLGLTPRQYEVLVLLARGYPMKKVGRALNISVATAKAHTETLYQRLDVHNRNAAVYTAVSRGATLGWAQVAAAQSRTGSS